MSRGRGSPAHHLTIQEAIVRTNITPVSASVFSFRVLQCGALPGSPSFFGVVSQELGNLQE
jgi:hypothetical protein